MIFYIFTIFSKKKLTTSIFFSSRFSLDMILIDHEWRLGMTVKGSNYRFCMSLLTISHMWKVASPVYTNIIIGHLCFLSLLLVFVLEHEVADDWASKIFFLSPLFYVIGESASCRRRKRSARAGRFEVWRQVRMKRCLNSCIELRHLGETCYWAESER